MSNNPQGWWGEGSGVYTRQGMDFSAFIALVFLLLIVPISAAIGGTWAIKFGQEELRNTDMEELRTRLEEDPWLFAALDWFRNVHVGALESLLIGFCIFFVVALAFGLLLAWGLNKQIRYGDTGDATYRRRYIAGGDSRQRVTKPTYSTTTSSSGYGDYGSSGYSGSKSEPAPNPLLQASRVDRTNFWGERNLRDSSGRRVGSLSNAMFSSDQVIKDDSGIKAGRIISGKFDSSRWDFSRQEIQDDRGNRVGDIKTNWKGERVIVDSDGKEIGKFKDGKIEKN